MTEIDVTEKIKHGTQSAVYEEDFYRWAMTNARLLREGRFAEIDVSNIAEELESIGKSQKSELVNRLAILIAHLLKWHFQPERRGKSWRATIEEQRLRIAEHLAENPSLRPYLDQALEKAYRYAVLKVIKQTPFDKNDLPTGCPYSVDQIFEDQFWPDR